MTEQSTDTLATLTFTKNEAEVMLHRLEFLDVVVCEELFAQDIDPEKAADFASSLVDLIAQHIYTFPASTKLQLEVLAETLEGSTFFGDTDLAVDNGELTKQKVSAFRRAANSAASKIEPLLGRPVSRAAI